MVAEPRQWVDVEAALRAWAREALPDLEGRVFSGTNNAAVEQVVVFRVAGPDDACLVQWDCWAQTRDRAVAIATALATALDGLARYEHAGAGGAVLLHGAWVEHVRWLPDEESDTPRYVVESTVTATGG